MSIEQNYQDMIAYMCDIVEGGKLFDWNDYMLTIMYEEKMLLANMFTLKKNFPVNALNKSYSSSKYNNRKNRKHIIVS